MTIRLLPDDALKTGDPALTRHAPEPGPARPRKPARPRGPAYEGEARALEHALDWLAHVEAGRIG